MMKALDTLNPIDEKLLDPRYYTGSLIQQAAAYHLLSEADISKIQSELFGILGSQCDKWSHGESSSVPIEKAQDMMTSILFVISIKLKSCHSPEQAVGMLKAGQLSTLFENGLKIVQRKIASSRYLHNRITENLFETPNVYYRSTIVDGIKGFFKLYRPGFQAHEIHITADYPVFAGRPELDGIEFILQYLHCIEAENAFCAQFSPQDIHYLLCGLTKDYQNIPMNLYEYVMLSAMGLALLGHNPGKLNLSKKDIENLYTLFSDKPEEKIVKYLEKAIVLLCEHHLLPEPTKQYLKVTLQKFVFTINNAVKTKTLDKVFLVPACSEK